MATIKVGERTIPLPASRLARIIIGILLIVFGVFGFLPVLGFWMIPVGLIVLSVDIPIVRRWRRQATVWLAPRIRARFPWLADHLGFRNGASAGEDRPYRDRGSEATSKS